MAYKHTGDLDKALEDFEYVIKSDRKNIEAYKNKSDIYFQKINYIMPFKASIRHWILNHKILSFSILKEVYIYTVAWSMMQYKYIIR